MVIYRAVRIPGFVEKRGWTIERVIPGERPVRLPFFGSKRQVEAEMVRLYELARSAPHPEGQNP